MEDDGKSLSRLVCLKFFTIKLGKKLQLTTMYK